MDQAAMKEVDLHQGLENTLTILHHQIKNGITVVRDYDQSMPRICAFGGELNQIWTNLMANAIEAMHGKGELRVRTARELDRVLVEIGDNGPGIPPEVLPRIFEPFFTTKGVGEGTGLGLDTVGRIIRNHHGEIRVSSHPGDTRFFAFNSAEKHSHRHTTRGRRCRKLALTWIRYKTHPLRPMGVRSACRWAIRGFICAFAKSAATSAAVIPRRTGTPPGTSERQSIPSCDLLNRAKIGDGATLTRS
jgi:hypothetical protein